MQLFDQTSVVSNHPQITVLKKSVYTNAIMKKILQKRQQNKLRTKLAPTHMTLSSVIISFFYENFLFRDLYNKRISVLFQSYKNSTVIELTGTFSREHKSVAPVWK